MADGKQILNMSARVFVANVPSEKTDNAQMKQRFEKYGKVLDVYVSKTFAFIQFETDTAATEAIKSETGTFIAENKIECSLARKQPKSMRPPEQNDGQMPPPNRATPAPYGLGGAGAAMRARERSPLGYKARRVLPRAYPMADPYYNEGYAGPEEVAAHDPRLVAEDPLMAPPRPRTPEYIRDMERRHLIQRRELEDNEMYHLERMRGMKEEHKLRMEILELEKQHLELKVYRQRQAIEAPPASNHAHAHAPAYPPQHSTPNSAPPPQAPANKYAYTHSQSLTSSTAYASPARASSLRPPSLMSQSLLNSGLY